MSTCSAYRPDPPAGDTASMRHSPGSQGFERTNGTQHPEPVVKITDDLVALVRAGVTVDKQPIGPEPARLAGDRVIQDGHRISVALGGIFGSSSGPQDSQNPCPPVGSATCTVTRMLKNRVAERLRPPTPGN